jgi:hypothetical protein
LFDQEDDEEDDDNEEQDKIDHDHAWSDDYDSDGSDEEDEEDELLEGAQADFRHVPLNINHNTSASADQK